MKTQEKDWGKTLGALERTLGLIRQYGLQSRNGTKNLGDLTTASSRAATLLYGQFGGELP